MVVHRAVLLHLTFLAISIDALDLFPSYYPDKDTCAAAVQEEQASYSLLLKIFIAVGVIVSLLLLAINIFIMRFIKNKLVVETETAMQKCFEVLDNVLVELMPRKIQAQLQTAINTGKQAGKVAETEKKEEGGEKSAASAVSQASGQK